MPPPRRLGGRPDVYLFAQSFVGYGENLLDYDRHLKRLRIGVALVREGNGNGASPRRPGNGASIFYPDIIDRIKLPG